MYISLYIEESSSSIELNERASMKHPVIVECYHVPWLKSVVDLENSNDIIYTATMYVEHSSLHEKVVTNSSKHCSNVSLSLKN